VNAVAASVAGVAEGGEKCGERRCTEQGRVAEGNRREQQGPQQAGDAPASPSATPSMVPSTAAGAPSVDVRKLGSSAVGISWPASARRLANTDR
jgi:hypothetical protein